MAKEHGLTEHKGKTIPKEVKSLADRIRKKDPGVSDEYAYRTAWDIFRSNTEEGKSYPHKSPESGLAREGGGTGPIHKKASAFWLGFEKRAMAIKAGPVLNYGAMAAERKALRAAQEASAPALHYGAGAAPKLVGASLPNTAAAKLKAEQQSKKQIQNALKGGYTQPQYERVGVPKKD